MRFAHISDLHLGKRFNAKPLIEEQRDILQKIRKIANEQKVDALLVAGCAILANLIDNAIEAASKVGSYEQHNENDGNSKDNRRVKLIIRRIQQMLVIKVENTYEIKPIVESGDYKTSKTDGGLHGWGIKSARTAAEKYDGMVQSSTTDDLFTTVVTLSFDGVKVSH